MPNPQNDAARGTDDLSTRFDRGDATPQAVFDALMASGVPRQPAMVAAYAGDGDSVRATLQAYGRSMPTGTSTANVAMGAPQRSDDATPIPVAARGATGFPDPPLPQSSGNLRPGQAGISLRPGGGYDLDPYYLDPHPEERHVSGWGDRVVPATREHLMLPQSGADQFAGVGLARDADGGYRLDPHYAAQTRTALDAGRRTRSWSEWLSGDGVFSPGVRAMPFGLAGPGSLNFDSSLDSNTRTLVPFERSLDDVRRALRPRRAGTYAGGYIAIPWGRAGIGGGAYIDGSGNIFPQIYFGSPGASFTIGHSEDLDAQLTGPSASATFNREGRRIKPGAGILYGFGPLSDVDMAWPLG